MWRMQVVPVIALLVAFRFHCCEAQANPITGLLNPKCVVVRGACPHENITFWLYTNETRDTPIQLNPLALNPRDFLPGKPVKILLHGYSGDREYSPNSHVRPALLDMLDVSVISVDYGALVPVPCYFAAVRNLPLAASCLGQLINNLVEQQIVQNEDLHIIGFSLGAQVAGQTANYVNKKLTRITGLDPAKPMFITARDHRKLDVTDADFVDVIHTDVLGRGMLRRMGHVDFYPNIGPFQPGCRLENADDPGSCNHDRAPRYYAESIRNAQGFWSFSCSSWFHYVFNLCSGPRQDIYMGFYVQKSARGSYFLRTAEKSPFALGYSPHVLRSSTPEDVENYYNIKELADDYFEPQLRTVFADIGGEYADYEEYPDYLDDRFNEVEARNTWVGRKTPPL